MTKTIELITGTVDKSYMHSIEDYKSHRGFNGLHNAVKMDREDIIQEIIDAKLLGRGGAGFPTGIKWRHLYSIEGEPKYIVCNADEGEPGTFKDRLIMKKDPLIVIEGMLISAYVFGSKEGYIYIRGEYRGLFEGFELALKNAREAGYLGKNILGIEGFDFDINIISGAGAYVCGENSTLLNSIEGQAGRPRVKPPRLAEVGLFGKPTLVNNVETFANIPIILDRGAEYYRSVGTEESGGSLIVCTSGHAKNRHYVEVPVGTNLKDIIYDEELAGGTSTRKPVKFVHIGGQSGPLAFPEQFDISFDHISLRNAGLSIGTGAIVIADESVCLVDYLKKVFEFFIDESCGKCNPCREGNQQMYILLDKFSKGEGTEKDIETMKNLAEAMMQASFCGLGQAAPTALMSALTHRESEFLAHVDKECSKCFNKEVM